VIILQEQRGGFHVVLFGGYVKRRKSHLAAKIVLQQNSNDLVMTLLQRNC